jgi:multidrug resistance efflux pump
MIDERAGANAASEQALDLDTDILESPADAARTTSPRAPWYRRPGPLIGVIAAVLIVALLGGLIAMRIARAQTRNYSASPVTQGQLLITADASGNVLAPEYDVAFQHQGTIASISVSIGRHVNSGDTLATLNYTLANGTTETETMTAPHAGTVVAINGVVDGRPTSSAFIQLDDLSAEYVVLGVNESDIASVATGQSVQFTVSAYPNLNPFAGKVTSISPAGQSNSNVITFPVTVSIDSSSLQSAKLYPAMSVNGSIITSQRDNVTLVPTSAVTFAQSEASNGAVSARAVSDAQSTAQSMLDQVKAAGGQPAADSPFAAYVLQGSGRQVKVTPVVLGVSDGTNYEVLAGLTAGDQVDSALASASGSATGLTVGGAQ